MYIINHVSSNTSISFYKDEKILAATTSHVRVFGLEDGNELVKLPAESVY